MMKVSAPPTVVVTVRRGVRFVAARLLEHYFPELHDTILILSVIHTVVMTATTLVCDWGDWTRWFKERSTELARCWQRWRGR